MQKIHPLIRPLDLDALATSFQSADPFPHLAIDDFLEPAFAHAVADAYPTYDDARRDGKVFFGLNERRKVQISDSARFPEPVGALAEALLDRSWLEAIAAVSGIDELVGDPTWQGGGMHLMGPGARLDVHVDFNVTKEKLHRRLNVLVFLNRDWDEAWGGRLELWDAEVKTLRQAYAPLFNRCILFATSAVSYHGVEALTCPDDRRRISFAGYYHTHAAPQNWDGHEHGTLFRGRPDEKLKGKLLIPLQGAAVRALKPLKSLRDK